MAIEGDDEFEREIDEEFQAEIIARQEQRTAEAAQALADFTPNQTRGQVDTALAKVDFSPIRRMRLEPSALHSLVRYPVAGQLWVVAAPTGIGKTTFLLSVIDDLVEQDVKVAFLGLEQEPDELRIAFACLRALVPRSVAIENSWREHEQGPAWYAKVLDQLVLQARPPLIDRLKLLPHRYIDTDILREAVSEAVDWGAQVIVVDHIHHIKTGGSFNEYRNLAQECKRLAEDAGLVMLVAAQVGRRGSFGHALQRYMPPRLSDIEGGDVLAQNANVILGLYRPIIAPDTDEKKKLIRSVEMGHAEANLVLRPWTMGVAVLKHRTRGEQEGKRVMLRLQDGHLLDPEPPILPVMPALYESKSESDSSPEDERH